MSSPYFTRLCLIAAAAVTLAIASTIGAERSSASMTRAASRLLKNLEPAQLQQATFPFESEERMHWHFIPTEMFSRKGLLVRDMKPEQRRLLHDLLKAG